MSGRTYPIWNNPNKRLRSTRPSPSSSSSISDCQSCSPAISSADDRLLELQLSLSKVDKEIFKCVVCTESMHDDYVCLVCMHRFCMSCYKQLSFCPLCRGPANNTIADDEMRSVLKVMFRKTLCDVLLLVTTIKDHEAKCPSCFKIRYEVVVEENKALAKTVGYLRDRVRALEDELSVVE